MNDDHRHDLQQQREAAALEPAMAAHCIGLTLETDHKGIDSLTCGWLLVVAWDS